MLKLLKKVFGIKEKPFNPYPVVITRGDASGDRWNQPRIINVREQREIKEKSK